MDRQPDILVVGGGVIGVCAAFYLAGEGRRVTLVERDTICSGSSYGNAGLIAADHALPMASPGALSQGIRYLLDPASPFHIKPRLDLDLLRWLWGFRAACRPEAMRRAIPALLELGQASLDLFAALDAAGLDFAFAHQGRIFLYRSESGLEKGLKEAQLLEEYGVKSQVLDAAEVRARVPAVAGGISGGIYYGGYAHCDPYRFVREMARACRERGVTLLEHTGAGGFKREGHRITAVRTAAGDFTPGQVVLAAGAWSPRLGHQLGLRLPVQAAKGYSITARRPAHCPDLPLALGEAKVAVTPMGEWLRFSSTLELAGFDETINMRRVAATRRALHEYLDGLGMLDEVETWQGLRPTTPDTLPLIGRSARIENLIVATGHGMLGLTQGPITGQIVAQLAAGEAPAIDLTPYRVERFV